VQACLSHHERKDELTQGQRRISQLTSKLNGFTAFLAFLRFSSFAAMDIRFPPIRWGVSFVIMIICFVLVVVAGSWWWMWVL